MGKYLDLIGLGHLIEKIQAMFIKKTDTIPATSLAIDTTPTNNSDHLITSGAVKASLDTKQDTIDSLHKLSADLIQDGTTNKVYTSTEKSKLAGIASGAEVNVQADWNVTNTSSDAYIKNKPTIPAAQIQSDWNQTTTTSLDYIKNKPSIPDNLLSVNYEMSSDSNEDLALEVGDTYEEAFGKIEKAINDNEYITSSALNELSNRIDDIPDPVKPDWNATPGSTAEILNKPTNISSFNNDSGYALLNSPTFIGTPTAPTQTSGDSSTQIATTAFVQGEISTQLGNIETLLQQI